LNDRDTGAEAIRGRSLPALDDLDLIGKTLGGLTKQPNDVVESATGAGLPIQDVCFHGECRQNSGQHLRDASLCAAAPNRTAVEDHHDVCMGDSVSMLWFPAVEDSRRQNASRTVTPHALFNHR